MKPPTIICDTREQAPLSFNCLPCQRDSLTTGDYSLAGFESSFAIERKTVSDLIGSLTTGRGRFMREVDRLRAFEFSRLLIVGARSEIEEGEYRSAIPPRAVLASLLAIEARGVPVAFSPSPEAAAAQIEAWAVYYFRERAKPFMTATELRELTARVAPSTKDPILLPASETPRAENSQREPNQFQAGHVTWPSQTKPNQTQTQITIL